MAIYNLNVGTAKGKYALTKYEYNMREGLYSKGTKGEELIYKTNENMPSFATNNPRFFWKSADEYERANSNQYRKIDGIQRNEREFFRKYNKKNPEKGGAKKEGDYWGKKQTLYSIRKIWENSLNIELEKKNIKKVSCESLKKQREEALINGDYLKAEFLDRPAIDIDMIESNRIKKSYLNDDDLIIKAKYSLAQEIKKIKEHEYYKKSKNHELENYKIFEEYNKKDSSIKSETDFIEKDSIILDNIDIFDISIEKQILKEQLYKKIALTNEKIAENDKKKSILSSNNAELNKIYTIGDKYEKYKESLRKDLSKLIYVESKFIPKEINKIELNILKEKQKEKLNIYKIKLNKITEEINSKDFNYNTGTDEEKTNYKKLKIEEKIIKKDLYLSLNKLKKLNSLDNKNNELIRNEFIYSRLEKLKEKEKFYNFMSEIEKDSVNTQKFDINSPEAKENFIKFHEVLTSNDEFTVSVEHINIDESFRNIKENELLKTHLEKTSLKEILYSELENINKKLEKNNKNINTKSITSNNYNKTKDILSNLINNSKDEKEIESLKNKIELINRLSNNSIKKLAKTTNRSTTWEQEKLIILTQIDSVEKIDFALNYSEEEKKGILKQKNFLEIERSKLLKEKEIFTEHLKIKIKVNSFIFNS